MSWHDLSMAFATRDWPQPPTRRPSRRHALGSAALPRLSDMSAGQPILSTDVSRGPC